jgi:hypothetical protein
MSKVGATCVARWATRVEPATAVLRSVQLSSVVGWQSGVWTVGSRPMTSGRVEDLRPAIRWLRRQVRSMTSTSLRPRIRYPQPAQSATAGDLTDRQVGVLVAIAAAVLIAALVLLVIYGGSGLVPASTSFQDLTGAAIATSI